MATADVYTYLSNMAEASKVSGEKYRRTFPEYDPVFNLQYAWKFFSRLVFPGEFEITALAFI